MKKLAVVLVTALLAVALCASAAADVAFGDRGEEVRYLQWLLKQTGWLSDAPDGVFGARTEQAVVDYQTAKGLEPTGSADAALMLELDTDRVRQDKDRYGQDYYQPYSGDFVPEQTASASATSHCALTVLPGIACQNSCARHLALEEQTLALSPAEAAALWIGDVASQLEEAGADALAESWRACFDAQRAALAATPGDADAAEAQALAMARNCAMALCELRSALMPADADMDSVGLSGEDSHCARWSIGADKVFLTPCADHAGLYETESAWVAAGAKNVDALGALADSWDAALAAQYDAWAARAGESAALVEAARAAFDAALSRQDAQFPDASGTLGHMRLAQLETARLCELAG